ncbi:MAG TPA: phosphate propanoyltransferase [Bacilli bacterium]|nr:phosphate propanoyltransferase [Bacilli bacterium]
MKVQIGVSARHIHLNEEDYKKLFGNLRLSVEKELVQRNEYASDKVVTIKGPKGYIENVRVLGPLRNKTQVEISITDSYKLGIKPPIRESGDLKGAEQITIISSKGSISKKVAIVPNRHIHLSLEEAKEYNLKDGEFVSVKVDSQKGGIMDNVQIRVDENYVLEMHIDTDDANAFLLSTGDFVEVIGK